MGNSHTRRRVGGTALTRTLCLTLPRTWQKETIGLKIAPIAFTCSVTTPRWYPKNVLPTGS